MTAKTIYEKSTKELMKDFASSLEDNQIINRKVIIQWFSENWPKIKKTTVDCHITKMTTNHKSRIYYSPASDGGDDVFYQIDKGKLRLYRPDYDSTPITTDVDSGDDDDDDYTENQIGEFAYENDLRNFLIKNLYLIEDELSLYADEGIKGVEFPVGGKYVDILAVDKNNNYVVIELKVSKGYDRVVGQLLRYIAWIEKEMCEGEQKVKGVIIARKISIDLILACSKIPDVSLFEYELSVKVNPIS